MTCVDFVMSNLMLWYLLEASHEHYDKCALTCVDFVMSNLMCGTYWKGLMNTMTNEP